jgi:hypothetical protein
MTIITSLQFPLKKPLLKNRLQNSYIARNIPNKNKYINITNPCSYKKWSKKSSSRFQESVQIPRNNVAFLLFYYKGEKRRNDSDWGN